MPDKNDLKPRKDKAMLIQAGRLQGRRENREIDELNATVAALQKELDDARAKASATGATANGKGKGKESVEVKAVQKEMGELQKKLRRLESERDTAVESRDALSTQLKEAQSSLAGDARLVETTAQLKAAQARVSALEAKLKAVSEECEVFQTRVRQLEQGAASTADLKRDKERKEYEGKVAKMEEKVGRLEGDKVTLAGQLRAAKTKLEGIESVKKALERDNERLEQQVKDADVLAERAEQALTDARAMSRGHQGCCSAEEKKRLTDKIAELEKLAATYEQRADQLEQGYAPSVPKPDSTSSSRRYRDLLENLRLSEDDVSTLLQEGADWPPVRAQMRSSSLIDLLWLLNDEQDEAEDDKKELQTKIARLEQDLQAVQRRAHAVEATAEDTARAATAASTLAAKPTASPASDAQARELEKERDELRRELQEAREGAMREKERKDETISELEARISAFESNAQHSRSPSRMSSGNGGGGHMSISSDRAQVFIQRLTATVNELNNDIAELRDENTALLLKLVGVE
ncbi:hypothetical protein JCM10207_004981 [Rhodosporidiobolus poonsookiae]